MQLVSQEKVTMPRALWKGALSFGLVYIPVQLHSASRDSRIDLDMLDKRDFAPIGFQRINKRTGKVVEWKNIVKGYQHAKGEYVALSEEDFRQANVKATHTIEISSFADRSDIPVDFYETPYFLEPLKGGEKVYALLREALLKTGKVAVATIVMHGRQHLAVVGANERALTLNTLRFAEERRSAEDLKLPPAGTKATGISAKELSMAQKLVEEMSGSFEPERYHDTYRDDLMKRINDKIRKGQTHALASEGEEAEERQSAQVIDLMAALEKSLKRRTGPSSQGTDTSAQRARTRTKTRAPSTRKRA
jgi:DNA end-binding protein Ku